MAKDAPFFGLPPPANLVVARALVDGNLELAIEAPAHIEVLAGQAIEVQFVYRLAEAQEGHDSLRLHLESSLDGQATRPQQDVLEGHDGWPKALDGGLIQRHATHHPGAFVLRFKAEAAYRRRAEGKGRDSPSETHAVAGQVDVVVK